MRRNEIILICIVLAVIGSFIVVASSPAAEEFAVSLPAYTVYRKDATYYAVNNLLGTTDFTDADPAVVVQACFTTGGAGIKIGLREGNYTALTGVTATADNQRIYGMGEGTYWNATALLTGVHAFTISGFTGYSLRNFAIETLGDGGLVNHCIFIEDGANDFHVIDITIIDSDSDGIHVEGTTIAGGHIHRCQMVSADERGIQVDMDAGNYMYRLHVEDCDIGNCRTGGIVFLASSGNNYCEVINNVIYSCGGSGIYFRDSSYSMIRGNIITDSGGRAINTMYSNYLQVLGNLCLRSGTQGIYLSYLAYGTVSENTVMNSAFEGIVLTATSYRNAVTGNAVDGSGKHGMTVHQVSDDNAILMNTFSRNEWHGLYLESVDNNVVMGNTFTENDYKNTGSYDGIHLYGCDRTLIMANQCTGNDRWGINVALFNDFSKVSNNYVSGNTAGSISVGHVSCDNTQIEFNTVEEGIITDLGTLTRAYGNYDPSADAFVGDVGAPPF